MSSPRTCCWIHMVCSFSLFFSLFFPFTVVSFLFLSYLFSFCFFLFLSFFSYFFPFLLLSFTFFVPLRAGNIKLTDFGMSTMFRSNGVERLLDRRCGTPPYVAPEACCLYFHHYSCAGIAGRVVLRLAMRCVVMWCRSLHASCWWLVCFRLAH